MTKYQYSKYAYTTGSNWKNLPASNLVDGKSASNSYKKGGNPAPVYFDVGFDIGVGNKVDNASFCISLPQRDGLSAPTVKFYDGSKYGRNVHKYPSYVFKTLTSPTKHGNNPKYPTEELREKGGFEGSTIWYKYYYNCKGITRNQLKNLIVGVDFGKSSSAGKARIGWARMEINYSKDTSYTLDIYSDDVDPNETITINRGQSYNHKINLHNNSEVQQTAYYKTTGTGGLNITRVKETGTMQTEGANKGYNKRYVPAYNKKDDSGGDKGEHICYWKYTPNQVGKYTITDTLKNKDDKGHSKSYKWYLNVINPDNGGSGGTENTFNLNVNDKITITPPFLYINTDNQFIEVDINGSTNALDDDNPYNDTFIYRWNANDNCSSSLNNMLKMVDYEVVSSNNCNVEIDVNNQLIIITVTNRDNQNFSTKVKVKVNPQDHNDYKIIDGSTDNDKLDGFYYEREFYEHSVYDELIVGYYHENNFYTTDTYTEPNKMTPQSNHYYYDRNTGMGYYFENNIYRPVVLAESIVYYNNINPVNNGIYLDVINKKRYKYYDNISIKVCREGATSTTAYVDIFGEKSTLYSINEDIETRYKTFCNAILSTSIMGINTIKCKSSRSCFFEEMDSDYTIAIEQPQAFIGVLPITRPHQADNKASTKNGLIKKSYLNRRYMGKTGEIDEEIDMELFLTPGEVATLQGLAELDKPVPINLVPHMKDGDPLNHRGWAELYEVDNIEKINSFTYKCEPKVDYLTHDLNTSFRIIKEGQINYFKVPYYLTLSHDFIDRLTDIMNVEHDTYVDMTDDYGYIGNYELQPRNSIIFTSNRPISAFADIDVKWRNIIEIFTSKDLDDNFSVKLQLIKNVDDDNPSVFFEYAYDEFKHYDATNGYTKNMFNKVYTRYLENDIFKEGFVDTNLSLLHNDLTTLAGLNKIYTKMWLNSNSVINDETYIDIILSTNGGMLIMGELVTVTIENDFDYYDKKVYMSDMYGRLRIPTNLEDGNYIITCEMPETKIYRPNTFKTEITVEKELQSVNIDYVDDYTSVNSNDTVRINLMDNNGNPLVNKNIIVDIRNTDSEHYGAGINYITDEKGYIYPVIKTDSGSKLLRARFISDGVYANDSLTQSIYVANNNKNDINIEADDVEYEIDQVNKEYVVRLTTENINGEKEGIPNLPVNFILYNNEEYIERQATTNESGFASIPIYITNGAWYIDTYYDGVESNYNPNIVTKIIKSRTNEKKETKFVDAINTVINDVDEKFGVTIVDNDNVPLKAKPVRFTATVGSTLLFDGIIISDSNGMLELPLFDVNGNVEVTIEFIGDNSYTSCKTVINIAYKYNDTDNYETTSIIKNGNTLTLYRSNNNFIPNAPVVVSINKLTENNELMFNSNDAYVIDPDIDEEYITTSEVTGNITLPNLPNGNYRINISYAGDMELNYKPCNITFIETYNDNVTHVPKLGNDFTINGEKVSIANGTINLSTLNTGIEYSNKIFKLGLQVLDSETNEVISNAYVKSESDCVSAGYTNENGIIELEVLNTGNSFTFDVDIEVDVGILYNNLNNTLTFNTLINNLNSVTTTANYHDEDYENLSYQQLLVNTTANTDDNQINKYYKIKLVNRNLNEVIELDYMGVNKFNNNMLNFYLDIGVWDMYIYGYNLNGYCDSFISKNLNITNLVDVDTTMESLIQIKNNNISNSIVDEFEDERMFGSLVRLELRDNKISVYDFGYTDNNNANNVKISHENIDIYNSEDGYYLRIIIEYYNVDNPLASNSIDKNAIEGYLQLKLVEDMQESELAKSYNNIVVSPVPLADDKCLFTRMTEDGRLYYYNYDKIENQTYIGSPYNQYKGGTNLMNELGTDLFDLDTGANPLYINNGICKMSIHRLSGYIELFVRDTDGEWLLVNVLKVKSDYTMSINNYSDDKISITYSGVTFTMWRGRPYIEIKHNGKDVEVLDYKDRVYCEINKNGYNMRLIEESNVDRGTFDINTSTQKFDKALQVGQNISLDNFDLYDVDDIVSG